MAQSGQVLRFPRESRAGALYLLRQLPGNISRDAPHAPVVVYLQTVADTSKRTQRVNLERAARLLGGESEGIQFEWRALTGGDLEFLRGRMRGRYSSSIINATLSAVRAVCHWAWRLGQIDDARLLDVRDVAGVRADRRARRGRALEIEEVKALFESCERDQTVAGWRDAAIITLLYGGGLRLREAVSLRLNDYVQRSHTLYVSGKGYRERRAYFQDGGARRCLHQWLRIRGTKGEYLLCPVTKSGEIETSRALSRTGLYEALRRRAERGGVEHFSPHDLRRSFGTHLDEAGESLGMIKELLGHLDPDTTERYIFRGERRKRKAAEKVEVPYKTGRRGTGRPRRRKGRGGRVRRTRSYTREEAGRMIGKASDRAKGKS